MTRQRPLYCHGAPPDRRDLRSWPFPSTFARGPEGFSHDVGVVVSFGYFLRAHLLDSLRHGAINMHPSLLPRVRRRAQGAELAGTYPRAAVVATALCLLERLG
jgi:hypothetical protein